MDFFLSVRESLGTFVSLSMCLRLCVWGDHFNPKTRLQLSEFPVLRRNLIQLNLQKWTAQKFDDLGHSGPKSGEQNRTAGRGSRGSAVSLRTSLSRSS